MREDYFAENIHGNMPNKRQKGGISVATLIICMIATAIFVLIIVAKWSNILSWFGVQSDEYVESDKITFSIGDDVSVEGEILPDGDMINYTHTIKSENGTKYALKSTKINLNNYEGNVSLKGIVEKIHQGLPIVLVDEIYNTEIDELDEDQTGQEITVQTKDLPKLGMYFDEKFFEKYALLNEGDNGVLKIKDLESNQIIPINYFKCDKNSINENCDKLLENLGKGASQTFVDSQGIKYYKQSEIQSWFFTNGKFGYFINDLQDSIVKTLSKYLIINKEDGTIKNGVSSGVNTSGTSSSEVNDIDGDSLDSSSTTQDSKSEQNQTDRDPNVAQFPVNKEKSLTFTSNKGHSYVFPSGNLAYQGVGASEDFNQVGVNCYSAMNVVKYSEKETVGEHGSVVIYECNVKNSFDDSDQSLIYRHVGDKDFVIKINDPAWVDFANNIEIKA